MCWATEQGKIGAGSVQKAGRELKKGKRVSMGLTVRRKTAKNLAVRRKNERILAVSRKKN